MPEKVWSGRFEKAADPLMERFSHSLDIDRKLFDADIAVNKAWAKALVGVGVYSAEEAERVCATLDSLAEELNSGALDLPAEIEDVHSAVEWKLTEKLGELGARIHTGRSRNDQVASDLRIYLKRANRELREALRSLQETLIDLAEDHILTVFPGRTHLQQAQPLSLAQYLMALFFQLQRDRERLHDADRRADRLPLGSGAVAGSAFAVDRHALARELGFSAPSENSYDATADRDVVLETEYCLAQIMVHLSRAAEDMVLWSSEAFGYIRLDDRFSTGSSMMPQKRNPDSLELVRGKAGRVIGSLVAGLTMMKGLPTAYMRDLQEDKPPLFDAVEQTLICVRVFERVVQTMTVNKETMRAALDPALYATDLADYLVKKGMPFRKAHAVVGRLVRIAEQKGVGLQELPLDDYRQASELFSEELYELFDPEGSMEKRNLYGGTGPAALKEQLQKARKLLAA